MENKIKNSKEDLLETGSDSLFSILRAETETIKIILAFLSVVTLHAIFYSLNLDRDIISIIDVVFIANITFLFSIYIAVAFFLFRLSSVLLPLIGIYLGFSYTLIHFIRNRKKANYTFISMLRRSTTIGLLMNRKLNKYNIFLLLSCSLSLFIIANFYTGYVVFILFIVLSFFTLVFYVLNNFRMKSVSGFLNSFKYITLNKVKAKLISNRKLRKSTVLHIYIFMALFSSITGHLHYKYMINLADLSIKGSGYDLRVKYIGTTDKGVIAYIPSGKKMMFISFDSGLRLSTNTTYNRRK